MGLVIGQKRATRKAQLAEAVRQNDSETVIALIAHGEMPNESKNKILNWENARTIFENDEKLTKLFRGAKDVGLVLELALRHITTLSIPAPVVYALAEKMTESDDIGQVSFAENELERSFTVYCYAVYNTFNGNKNKEKGFALVHKIREFVPLIKSEAAKNVYRSLGDLVDKNPMKPPKATPEKASKLFTIRF